MIVHGSREVLKVDLEEQKVLIQRLEQERNAKREELEGYRNKVNELKQWLNTLLTISDAQLDIVPQIRTGLGEIEALRDSNFELRKRLYAEKRRYFALFTIKD